MGDAQRLPLPDRSAIAQVCRAGHFQETLSVGAQASLLWSAAMLDG